MAICEILRQILSIEKLEIPKQNTPFPPNLVRDVFGSRVQDMEEKWLVPCTHSVAPPVSPQQIRNSEIMLDTEFPGQLADFLHLCNGAKLFVAPKVGRHQLFPETLLEHVRYRLFGTDELVEVNRGLWENFRSLIDTHPDAYPEHHDVRGLN